MIEDRIVAEAREAARLERDAAADLAAELPDDPAAAAVFYGPLFGWCVEAMDMGGGPYHVLKYSAM